MIMPGKTYVAIAGSLVLTLSAVGCSSHEPVPALDHTATLTLASDPISRQAPASGEVSVLDVNQEKIVFSGYVKQNEVITLDPTAKRLMIGNEVAAENLHGGDEYRISFDPAM